MSKINSPTIICITPVKNEAWILDIFLKCASLWADHIIIADQGSEDGSREIAARYEKATLIDNPSPTFNEPQRQKMLLEAARKIPGKRLIIALDADEILTPEVLTSLEWNEVLSARQGTVIQFNWANIRPGFCDFWSPPHHMPFGFMDDGSEHIPKEIHSPRVPIPLGGPVLKLNEIKVIHFQYTHWERMLSKHRWYQCWERVKDPKRCPVSIFRQYHHMFALRDKDICLVPIHWLDNYKKMGINVTALGMDNNFYWDRAVLEYFQKLGTSFFAKEAIWNSNWVEKALHYDIPYPEKFRDPRTLPIKLLHLYLWKTQLNANSHIVNSLDHYIERFFCR